MAPGLSGYEYVGKDHAAVVRHRMERDVRERMKVGSMKVGVILNIGEDPSVGAPPSYAHLRSLGLQVENAGFDSVWVYDHLLYRFPDRPTMGIWEAWTIFSALCEATQRVELGQLVMCLPFRNPALLAKMAITADEVSGGRTILGLGAGWHQPEFDAFGVPFHHLADQFQEGLEIIGSLLREGNVDARGTYFSAPECEMRPRGPRPGGPPIHVAARGPRMLRLTAQHADGWNAAWFGRPTQFHERRAAMLAACAEVGRDPDTLEMTVGVSVGYPDLGELPEIAADPDKFLTGSPEEIASGLKEYADLGVAHVIVNANTTRPEAVVELSKALDIFRAM
jgi:alkanesulfonate monooxygenase SsuD/methylene tetrahydromethanopterin reductase-like flavin-dependent oxidoreductase (luciferase family)